jgi:hypothetical protein
MAYIINRFDGTQLTIVDDGVLDISTPLGLIGRNYSGYGETQNENFVFLLENFANTAPPARALRGQIWYNTTEKALKTYNGTDWLSIGNATVAITEPAHSLGGLWLNSITNQMYVSDGITWRLVGPEGVEGFSVTKMTSTKIRDTTGTFKPVIISQINGEITAILTNESFVINPQEGILGFNQLYKGINLKSDSFLTGNVKGSSESAGRLETSRTINGVAFDGTSNIVVAATTTQPLKPGDYILGSEFNGAVDTTWNINATPENQVGKIVARDSTGSFSATTITAAEVVGNLIGNVTTLTGTSTFNNIQTTSIVGDTFSGLSARATRLETPRTINTVPFDGTSDVIIPFLSQNLVGSTLAPNVVNSSLTTLGQLEYLNVEAPGITVGDGNNINIKIEGFTPTIESDTTNILKLKLATGGVNVGASTTLTFLSASSAAADGVFSPAFVPDYTLGTSATNVPVLGLPSYRWKNIYSVAANLDTLNVTTLSGRTIADQVIVSKDLVVNGNVYGILTGSVLGTASLNVLKTGDTMSGDIGWITTGRGIEWRTNTDGASIRFYNTGDGDADSRLEFNTFDNSNEYFRWVHTNSSTIYESMRLVPNSSGNAVLTVTGNIISTGSLTGTHIGNGSQLTNVNASQLSSGTVPSARLAGTYNINISGNAATADRAQSAQYVDALTYAQIITALGYLPAAVVDDPLSQIVVGISATISGPITSTSTSTGALVVAGGAGFGLDVTVGGTLTVNGTTQSSSTTTGSIITAGGVGVAKNVNVGGTLGVTGNTTVSTITSSGLATLSSVSVTNDIAVNGNLTLSSGYIDARTGTLYSDTLDTGAVGTAGVITGNWSLSSTSNLTLGTGSIDARTGTLYSDTLNTGSSGTAGEITGNWTLSAGSRLQATYADLAEFYTSDNEYEPGTVLVFGGPAETTVTNLYGDQRLAGVVSTDPAYLMNSGLSGTVSAIALAGRVPCKVTGRISKGDMLTTSSILGYATKMIEYVPGAFIGKALQDKNSEGPGVVEISVNRA